MNKEIKRSSSSTTQLTQPQNNPIQSPVEKKRIKPSISLRVIVFLLVVAFLVMGIFYKYNEWKVLYSLIELFNSTETEELALIEEYQNLSNKTSELIDNVYSPELTTVEEQIVAIDELQGQNQLLNNSNENYSDTLINNLESYKSLQNKVRLLLGKRGQFAREVVEDKVNYYQAEMESSDEAIVEMSLFINTFKLEKDRIITDNYIDLTSSSETYYSEQFSDLAVLEKYADKDFKFENEEKIRELFPYGYKKQENLKNFLSSSYKLIKDYVAGDYESAVYKASRLRDESLELGVDYDRLLDEGKERRNERGKIILDSTVNIISNINEFEEENLGRYPMLQNLDYWKEDLVSCQLYLYKAQYYKRVTGKTPESSDFDIFLEEMTKVSPKTNKIDINFNREVIKFTNNDETLEFQCLDKASNTKYIFSTQKPKSEVETSESN